MPKNSRHTSSQILCWTLLSHHTVKISCLYRVLHMAFGWETRTFWHVRKKSIKLHKASQRIFPYIWTLLCSCFLYNGREQVAGWKDEWMAVHVRMECAQNRTWLRIVWVCSEIFLVAVACSCRLLKKTPRLLTHQSDLKLRVESSGYLPTFRWVDRTGELQLQVDLPWDWQDFGAARQTSSWF